MALKNISLSGFKCQCLCSSFLTPETLRYGTKMGLKFHLYTKRFSPPQVSSVISYLSFCILFPEKLQLNHYARLSHELHK